jgi:hypothetical protein
MMPLPPGKRRPAMILLTLTGLRRTISLRGACREKDET